MAEPIDCAFAILKNDYTGLPVITSQGILEGPEDWDNVSGDDIEYDGGLPVNPSSGKILCEIDAEQGRATPATYRIRDHQYIDRWMENSFMMGAPAFYFSDLHYDEVKRINIPQVEWASQEEIDNAVHWWETYVEHSPEGWFMSDADV